MCRCLCKAYSSDVVLKDEDVLEDDVGHMCLRRNYSSDRRNCTFKSHHRSASFALSTQSAWGWLS